MDCRDARDLLLEADDPSEGGNLAPELAAHVAGCAACRQLAEDVLRLELAWRSLPVPDVSGRAKAAFLDRLRVPLVEVVPQTKVRRQTVAPVRWLVAASVLVALGIGGSLIVWMPRAQASSDVVERLVHWNLDLSEARSPAERSRIYDGNASSFNEAVRRARLPEDERELAESLLQNAPWLTRNKDPLDEADRFNEVADKLATRMRTATRGGDSRRAGYYARLYRKVQAQGIEAKLETLEKSGTLDFDRRRKLERIVLRDDDRMNDLLALLERTPDPTRKEIKQALGLARKSARNKVRQSTKSQSDDRR